MGGIKYLKEWKEIRDKFKETIEKLPESDLKKKQEELLEDINSWLKKHENR